MVTAAELMAARRRAHPPFFRAVAADARATLQLRMEGERVTGRLALAWQVIRLSWVADAFFAQVCYRAKARLQRFRIPILPTILHRVAMMHSQVCIGNPVVIGPGLYLPHGQVVIDGITVLGPNCTIAPWVTIGLKAGNFQGPTIAERVSIGTGAKLIGPITINSDTEIGANAVVLTDIPARSVAVGVPAAVRQQR